VKRTAHNARLTMLVNEFAAAVLLRLRQDNGGEWFPLPVNGQIVHVAVTDGESGILLLVDSWMLSPIEQEYTHWEAVASELLTGCLANRVLTQWGHEIRLDMLRDMSDSLSKGGIFHA